MNNSDAIGGDIILVKDCGENATAPGNAELLLGILVAWAVRCAVMPRWSSALAGACVPS